MSGSAVFEGQRALLRLPEREMQGLRGDRLAMIFQEPMTSLNPSLTVGDQIGECYRVHMGHSKKVARDFTEHVLQLVRLPSPHTLADRYPHELSGGMRQRVMIAMGLACQPKLLIADEPTTALDVTIQAQILELLVELQRETGAAMILITHDLGMVARMADHVVVMYAGEIVETGARGSPAQRPAAPLYGRPAWLRPAYQRPARSARHHPGQRAEPLRRVCRLPFLSPVPVRRRPLPQPGATARQRCHRP